MCLTLRASLLAALFASFRVFASRRLAYLFHASAILTAARHLTEVGFLLFLDEPLVLFINGALGDRQRPLLSAYPSKFAAISVIGGQLHIRNVKDERAFKCSAAAFLVFDLARFQTRLEVGERAGPFAPSPARRLSCHLPTAISIRTEPRREGGREGGRETGEDLVPIKRARPTDLSVLPVRGETFNH